MGVGAAHGEAEHAADRRGGGGDGGRGDGLRDAEVEPLESEVAVRRRVRVPNLGPSRVISSDLQPGGGRRVRRRVRAPCGERASIERGS